MFDKARLKLTFWYVVVSMMVSLTFSILIFRGISLELERSLRRAEVFRRAEDLGVQMPQHDNMIPRRIEQQLTEIIDKEGLPENLMENLSLAKRSFLGWLSLVNSFIFVVSLLLGYLVSGLTLEPIKRAMDKQKKFIADASHELKTPLAVMKTSIEVTKRNKNSSKKDFQELADSLLEEVDGLKDLTVNLLSLASFDQQSKHFDQLDLDKNIDKVIKRVAPMAKEKKIKIVTDLDQIGVKGDSDKLEKLWMILLDNAIKYTPQGGTVSVVLKPTKDKVGVEIADTGVGIQQQELDKIFDRFYRADSSRSKESINGYGLGLAIAKQIANLHRGTIVAQSQIDIGSKFIVSLPLV